MSFKMKCCICDSNDWENVDEYRLKPSGMSICKNCGFVSYPSLYKTKEEIINFYREEYRAPPNSQNLFTGQRKLHYHAEFLHDLIKQWNQTGKDREILEVGSAYGMFLNWINRTVKNSTVTGTEITKSYKRVAKHEFGLDLVDDFSDSQQFDLICTYKVAEHMLDIDLEMARYHKTLKDDGILYIGVPCWFNTMHNFGAGGWDIEYYYSTNHINVWTRKAFESLLKKTGFKIIKQDHEMYDSVYLCVKTTPEKLTEKDFDGYDSIMKSLKKVKEANDLFVQGKYVEAFETWNDFPTAIINGYEINRKQYDSNGFEWIEECVIKKARKYCNNSPGILPFIADLYTRYGKLDLAIKAADEGLRKRPRTPHFIIAIASSFYQLAEKCTVHEEQQKLYKQSRDLYRFLLESSQQNRNEAINWIYALDSKIEV